MLSRMKGCGGMLKAQPRKSLLKFAHATPTETLRGGFERENRVIPRIGPGRIVLNISWVVLIGD